MSPVDTVRHAGYDVELFDSEALEHALSAAPSPLPAFRDAVHGAKSVLSRRFLSGTPADELVHQRAWAIDQLLVHAWRRFVPPSHPDLALVAVGGYGRSELHPGSDIDILVLVRRSDIPASEAIEQFVALLWDIGLEIGHSVRSPKECERAARTDITVATTLMESRLLAGPEDMYREMRRRTGPESVWPSREFFAAKRREQTLRHHKFGDTGYSLEPNVKESPGGLRDIQIIGWVAKRHFGANTLESLVEHRFLTATEYAALVQGQNYLWRIRFALHELTGRREDRLLFDYQRTLAEQFGFRDARHHLAVEQFMRRYYQTVMELSRLNDMLLQHFEEAILHAETPVQTRVINKRFQASGGFIEVRSENTFSRYPFALLEIFLLLAHDPELKGVRAATIRLIRAHTHLIDDAFRNDLRNRTLFMELLRQPRGVTHELRRMNRYGVLAAYLPAFGKTVGMMQYDLFHVYTVDEHTLTVVRNLRRFGVAEYSEEFPLCSEIYRRLPKPELLYIAGLFHDIGKGRGGDHSEIGTEEATAFCLHHGLSRYDTRLVAWLVRHHLILSMTAQRHDISDPDVINDFAARVGDETHLDYLYLLTVADIRGTNPSLWNSWRDALLRQLYLYARRALGRGLENPIDKRERIHEIQTTARLLLMTAGLQDEAITELWSTLADDYFLHHTSEEISWHSQAILRTSAGQLPVVLVRNQAQRGGTEIFIYTQDQEHLFAITTWALDQMNLSIMDARIITTDRGMTLDTYIVLDQHGAPVSDPFRIGEITDSLRSQLTKPKLLGREVTRRPHRLLRHFPTPTRVHFETDERNARTVMWLSTADRPGLLSLIGQALVQCSVELRSAKIATLGAQVEDVFFLTDKNKQAIHDPTTLECLRDAIVSGLEEAR